MSVSPEPLQRLQAPVAGGLRHRLPLFVRGRHRTPQILHQAAARAVDQKYTRPNERNAEVQCYLRLNIVIGDQCMFRGVCCRKLWREHHVLIRTFQTVGRLLWEKLKGGSGSIWAGRRRTQYGQFLPFAAVNNQTFRCRLYLTTGRWFFAVRFGIYRGDE